MNCGLAAIVEKMSLFEIAIWNWYNENVNRFTLESGFVADELRRMRIRGPIRRLVLAGLNDIYLTFEIIALEKKRKALSQSNG